MPPGDLYVEVQVVATRMFDGEGDDLHCTVTLPMTAAALGTQVRWSCSTGWRRRSTSGPGTQSGQEIPLHGQGVPQLRGSGRGDLIVHVVVETPTKLDEPQQQLLRQLAGLRGEERPEGQFTPGQQGFFSRLKDAFNGR